MLFLRRAAIAFFILTLLSSPGLAEETGSAPGELPAKYRQWLETVSPLISGKERDVFLKLTQDYQREAFIRRFWQVRDPFPETGLNKFRERWERRLALAHESYEDLTGDRARMLLLVGKPDDSTQVTCIGMLRPLEIWYYSHRDEIGSPFYLVFVANHREGPYKLWRPIEGLDLLLDRLTQHRRKKSLEQEEKEDWYELMSKRSTIAYGPNGQVVVLGPKRPPPSKEEIEMGPPPVTDTLDFMLVECHRSELIISAIRGAVDPDTIRFHFQPIPDPETDWAGTFYIYATGSHLSKVANEPQLGSEPSRLPHRLRIEEAENRHTRLPIIKLRYLRPGDGASETSEPPGRENG